MNGSPVRSGVVEPGGGHEAGCFRTGRKKLSAPAVEHLTLHEVRFTWNDFRHRNESDGEPAQETVRGVGTLYAEIGSKKEFEP